MVKCQCQGFGSIERKGVWATIGSKATLTTDDGKERETWSWGKFSQLPGQAVPCAPVKLVSDVAQLFLL